jgi:hypothetical protein
MNSKETRFFVILKNKEVKEIMSFEENKFSKRDVLCLIKDEFKYIFKNTNYDWRKSNYIFYNPENEKEKIQINNWKIESIDIKDVSSNGIYYRLSITDPNLELKCLDKKFRKYRKNGVKDTIDIELIIDTINELEKYSKYNNWNEYKINNENEELKKENKNLKDELRSFKINKNTLTP